MRKNLVNMLLQAIRYTLSGLYYLSKERFGKREVAFFIPIPTFSLLRMAFRAANAVVESICNSICHDHDDRIRSIKDLGTASVVL